VPLDEVPRLLRVQSNLSPFASLQIPQYGLEDCSKPQNFPLVLGAGPGLGDGLGAGAGARVGAGVGAVVGAGVGAVVGAGVGAGVAPPFLQEVQVGPRVE